MHNAGLKDSKAATKTAGRNSNNLRYADDNAGNGRKQRGSKEPLDEGEGGEGKSWLNTKYLKN